MIKGTVRWFDASKGFGFIQPHSGEDVFVHIKDVRMPERTPLEQGQQVTFVMEKVARGYRAVDVVVTAQATVRYCSCPHQGL